MITDLDGHLGFFRWLVEQSKPQRILELGIRDGISSHALRYDGCDHHTCDIVDCSSKVPWTTFHHMSTNDLAKQWNLPIDILFIDADHAFESVRQDFENFQLHVRGWILFHDTCPPSKKYMSAEYCHTAYKIRDYVKGSRFETITFPWSFGLTVCRKV